MVRFPKPLSSILCLSIGITLTPEPIIASQIVKLQAQETKKPEQETQSKKEKRARRAERKKQAQSEKEPPPDQPPNSASAETETVEIIADTQSKNGDIVLYEGYVNATQGDVRLQADRVTFNTATNDLIAEGNVLFDQGPDQRVTARRAEINLAAKRGTFWDTTGFTNRTQTGDYVFFTAKRVEKTGPDTYELYDADVTACEDVIPKWTFKAKRAELKMGDRVIMRGAVFHVKTLPVFVLPYAWIPATRKERKSGFLLPTTGNSNQKGRTLKLAYYQTLGQSADITFRGDLYTQRGLGMGAEFRAQTDEKSFLRLGVFTVKDRLFGAPGENQGGTAFIADGVQYLPHGWLAVGNVSIVSSLAFRQVFSDDITQVIDPRRESTFYANNNTSGFSFNFLASNETTTLFAPSRNPLTPSAGTNFDIKIRQAPEIEATVYPRRVFDSVPVYFSLDSSVGALKREEIADSNVTLVTPAAVQRFDFQPMITVPLATLAGIAITPSLTLRETFYTSGIDPSVPVFDPNIFTFNPADPRIDPKRGEFNPSIKLFDRNSLDRISADSVSRNYAELAVHIRPPSLEKDFLDEEGQTRFKHLIEPSITYRLIGGIGGEFNRIIRFDDRDAVANTNEIEYSLINRFFTRQLSADVTRRRAKGRRTPSMMKPVRPGEKNKAEDKTSPDSSGAKAAEPAVAVPPPEQDAKQKPEPAINKSKLEKGEQAEFEKSTREAQQKQAGRSAKEPDQRAETQETESNQAAVVQPYELLTVKVAQKYFFDRDFGGALVEGRRNQFYPINTLSGFTFGGRARSFSPVNVSMRYRPLSSVYGDLRMDVGSDDGIVRNLSVGAGVRGEKVSVSASYYLSRRIKLDSGSFEPGTFPGNQVSTTIQFGDGLRGAYGGSRIGYDFTNRFISDTEISKGRLMNSRSYIGYAWDCCGLQFNYNTFKAGLRNESAWSVTFTLAGLGSFGTDQFSQLGGGSGGRKRGKRSRRAEDDYFP